MFDDALNPQGGVPKDKKPRFPMRVPKGLESMWVTLYKLQLREIYDISSVELLNIFFESDEIFSTWIHQQRYDEFEEPPMSSLTFEDFLSNDFIRIHRIENEFRQMARLWPKLFEISYEILDVDKFKKLSLAQNFSFLFTNTGNELMPKNEVCIRITPLEILYNPVFINLPSKNPYMTFGEVERVDVTVTVKKPRIHEPEDIKYMVSRTNEEDTLLLSEHMQNCEIHESESEKDNVQLLDASTHE